MTLHLAVTVHHASEVKWKPRIGRQLPNLYVELACGGSDNYLRTKEIHRNIAPQWEETIPLRADDGDLAKVLNFRLKHNTSLPIKDPIVGVVEVEIETLLSQCDEHEEIGKVALALKDPSGKAPYASPGTIWVSAKNVGAVDSVRLAIQNAEGAIDTSDIKNRPGGQIIAGVELVSGVISTQPTLASTLNNLLMKLDCLNTVVSKIDDLAKVHPYANLAWQICSSLYKAAKTQLETDGKMIGLVGTMNDTFSFVEDLDGLPDKIVRLEDIITSILQQTAECALYIREYVRQSFAGRMLEQLWKDHSSKIDEFTGAFTELQKSLDSGMLLQNTFVTSRTLDAVSQLLHSDTLQLLNPTSMDASMRPECLPGTRVSVLEEIIGWLVDSEDVESEDVDEQPSNVLWMHGLAGSGKSTIATTIAEHFRSLQRRGAFLFFERSKSDPAAVIRTLAYHLANFDPQLRSSICAAIDKDRSIAMAPLRTQFTKLLLEPLTAASELLTQGPIVIVLDALDECGNMDTRGTLLSLISQEFPKLPSVFRFLITSRAEPDIDVLFSENESIKALELSVATESSIQDIRTFIRSQMTLVREKQRVRRLPADWPGEENIDVLAANSGGLFIWASTMTKFLYHSYNPTKELNGLLASGASGRKIDLDALYVTALQASGEWQDEQFCQDFRSVAGVVLFCKTPLNDAAIDELLGLPEDNSCQLVLIHLRCLLDYSPGQPVRPLHASFRDYLTDTNRSGSHPWSLDATGQDLHLALCSFRLLSEKLHFNMCELETSHTANAVIPDLEERIEEHLSWALQYAATEWWEHLAEVSGFDNDLHSALRSFSQEQSLFWLEVLSLIDRTALFTLACDAVLEFLQDHDEDLSALWRDADRFVAQFNPVISQSTSHLYISALPFAPRKSRIYTTFASKFPQVLRLSTGYSDYWHANIGVLEGHTSMVMGLACDPHGQLIASGSGDSTLRLWGMHGGQSSSRTLYGHTRVVQTVAFLP
ncbi:hypothetical protein QCA50_013388 [Cerrena zonata]|uniref:C2 domain-containing protein n=1 Tax=Cerrena zonata TaxID=2478898 RepID=A0AAW0G0W3_9APHY